MANQSEFLRIVTERSAAGDVFFRPILMQFAAHQIGKSYRDFYLDHENLVAANIACMETFGMDAVGLISDPMREAEAFGAVCDYQAETGPHCANPPVKTLADVYALQTPDLFAAQRTADRIAGVKLYRQRLGSDVPVIGWIEGPLAEACDLVGVSDMMMQLALDPEFSHQLLAKLVPTAKAFASAQIEAGCDIIGMGDAICSQISPKMYVRFVKEYHREIIDFIHSQGALVKVHICGNITHLLPHLRELQPDIVDCDWMIDMDRAYETLGPDIIRAGNLDPAAVVEQLSAEAVYDQTKALVEKERGRPFILSGGCEITPLTPPENLLAMRAASRNN
jgi:uroporphyrinogen decarboxylase